MLPSQGKNAAIPLDIEHADFEWLRAYLQREEVKSVPQVDNDAELSDSASTIEEGWDQKPGSPYECQFNGNTKVLTPTIKQTWSESTDGSGTPYDEEYGEEEAGCHDSKRRRKVGWTSTEDLAILATVRRLGTQWPRIAAQLPGRTPDAVRNRWHRLQKTHSLGDSEEGRAALDALLLACGISKDWEPPPDPRGPIDNACIKGSDHGRAMWTAEEDALIEEGVRRFGCKWRQIASSLPGRSDSSVRNRWMRLQKEHASARGDESPSTPSLPYMAPLTASPETPLLPQHLNVDAFAKHEVDAGHDVPPSPAETALSSLPEEVRRAAPHHSPPTHVAQPPMQIPMHSRMPQMYAAGQMQTPLMPTYDANSQMHPLKRGASSLKNAVADAANGYGFNSTCVGFDLTSFVEAVSGAIDETGQPIQQPVQQPEAPPYDYHQYPQFNNYAPKLQPPSRFQQSAFQFSPAYGCNQQQISHMAACGGYPGQFHFGGETEELHGMFEVCEAPDLRSSSSRYPRRSADSTPLDADARKSPADSPKLETPPGLGLVSGLLAGLAAITIGTSLAAALRAR